MIKQLILLAVIAFMCCSTVPVSAGLYVGSVNTATASPNGNMVVGGEWEIGSLSWDINPVGGGVWNYKYIFTVGNGPGSNPNLSHIIMELSLGVTGGITGLQATGGSADIEIEEFGTSGSNPGIPGNIFGVKIEGFADTNPITFSFNIERAPVWGDFYAKGGNTSFAYNAGFIVSDPIAGPTNGSLLDHILRPDTTNGVAPEVSSLVGWGLCATLAAFVAYRRRRARQ